MVDIIGMCLTPTTISIPIICVITFVFGMLLFTSRSDETRISGLEVTAYGMVILATVGVCFGSISQIIVGATGAIFCVRGIWNNIERNVVP